MTKKHTPESATALLALVGVAVEPSRAASVADTLNTQVTGANKAFAALTFETEPATYLKVAAEEAP
ncbi:MAG: hypothetical protein WCO67_11280 [Betaproteobacteria bacterium]|jgi:hypothetical protein|nr:hypothetical protein [Pseudomonadota bacterium]